MHTSHRPWKNMYTSILEVRVCSFEYVETGYMVKLEQVQLRL